MHATLIEHTISQANKSDQLFECAYMLCNAAEQYDQNHNNKTLACLFESATSLRTTIQKVLTTTKSINQHLAYTIAKTVVLVRTLEHEIAEHKNVEFIHILQQVLDIASSRLEDKYKANSNDVNVVKEITGVLTDLRGHAEKRLKVTEVVNKIVEKISKRYDKDSLLDVMKLTSTIMQSNDSSTKRVDLIKSLIK